MQSYLELLKRVYDFGENATTRNGIRRTAFGAQLRYDLTRGLPLVTTRHIPTKNPRTEMPWFLRGDTTTEFLHRYGVSIWDANADKNGNVGKIYGYQWRYGFGVDQIVRAVAMLKKNPRSTRNVVTAWNPVDMDEMALPPCHFAFQLHSDGKHLTLQFSMRSTDLVLGLPTNIAGYAILAHLFAKVTGQKAVELICDLGNIHIYSDHFDGVAKQLQREPMPLPTLAIMGEVAPDLFTVDPHQLLIQNYYSHPTIKFNMSV